jgi:hypothetical protein
MVVSTYFITFSFRNSMMLDEKAAPAVGGARMSNVGGAR